MTKQSTTGRKRTRRSKAALLQPFLQPPPPSVQFYKDRGDTTRILETHRAPLFLGQGTNAKQLLDGAREDKANYRGSR